jgi:Carboxypeptidase regulatory-like domain
MTVAHWTKFSLASLLFCFLASGSSAGTLTGTVQNGTTGKPAAGVEVILINLQGDMEPVASTRTDSEGHYRFDQPMLGTAPMLIRAVYRGVDYHEPVTPGATTADVEVFEPTDKPGSFTVSTHAIILQPSGSDLIVGEEYSIQNKTQPPLAYYRAGGSFRFSLPDGAQLDNVSAVSSAGIPTVQTPIDKGKHQKAIAFPFRPGQSGVRLSYKVPYPGDRMSLRFASPYAVERLAIFAPPAVQVSADGFAPAGQEQGYNVYMRESVAANTPVTVSVSGTAPTPAQQGAAAGGDDSRNASVNSRADSDAETPTASVTMLPARLDSLKWILAAGFAALFALGLFYLWRQPQSAAATADATVSSARVKKSAPVARAAPASPKPAPVADMDREVRDSLDELKDALFRLELRREAGTITEEDYTRERERVQKTLRDLVKG